MRTPMSCEDARSALSAKLDHALFGDEIADLNTHLLDCEACKAYGKEIGALHSALKEHLDDGMDEAQLWDKVGAVLNAENTANLQMPPSASRRGFLKFGLAASVLMSAGIGGAAYVLRPSSPDIVAETINDYLTFRVSGKTLHIAAGDHAVIEAWLEERLDFDLAIRTPVAAGLHLTGGRLCSFLGRRLAALHFVDGDEGAPVDASLYVMRAEGLEIKGASSQRIQNRTYRTSRQQGVASVIWEESDLLFAAVSSIPDGRLLDFAENL